jgi:NAD(P)-dependent dehydrogenase (short-subunit alcohol dehydrogenase family)
MKKILITGCSSGFGVEIARHFLGQGWQVVATMRAPRDGILSASDKLTVLPLDVTDAASIAAAIEAAGPLDALVNNAGIGWLNAVEGTPMDMAREIFEANTFGSFAMTQAVLPQMRARRAGVIVNVTSSVTLKPLTLLAVYTASKAAVNAFTECLALEVQDFGVRAHLVLPGRSPETKFSETARGRIGAAGGFPEAYAGLVESVFATFAAQAPEAITRASDVAEAVWRAVTDASAPMRIAAGKDAVALMA